MSSIMKITYLEPASLFRLISGFDFWGRISKKKLSRYLTFAVLAPSMYTQRIFYITLRTIYKCVKYINCEYDIRHKIKHNLACTKASRYFF